jgi:hypothetical protein
MRKKRIIENVNDTKKIRKLAERYQTKRDVLMERTLLGLDDGTPDAAMNESLSFDKFEDLWEDENQEALRLQQLREAPEPTALTMLKRHREKISALKIRYNR